tara:strand:- start:2052 stop:2453 length:402 start_codon:yes stop_codon:yes gene_type:complete
MNELKTLQIINELCKVKLEKTIDKHCSYDAENSNHIAEIKNRRTYYSTKMIEASKLFINYQKAQLKSKTFIYVVTDPKGVYIFNITKLIDDILKQEIVKNIQPSTTDFKNSKKIIKFYYNLKEEMSSFTFVFN